MIRPSPILSLRAALRTMLAADVGVTALLGGPRIYDEAPAGTDPPYVVFGDAVLQDWSAGDVAGARQRALLIAWSSQGGDSEALGIVAALTAAVESGGLVLSGHRLVLLRIVGHAVSRPGPGDPSAGLRRATLTLEALTEPA
ncbi:MAG: DUF3168 domain-containing protein [Alsobacter sp.]